MATSFTSTQIERFRREAKQLCRATPNLTHSAALDRIAIQNGYANWSLLHKHSQGDSPIVTPPLASITQSPFTFERTPEEMRLALRKLPETRYRDSPRTDEARAKTESIRDRFVSAENAVDFAVAYVSSLLTAPRFYIYPASRANWELRCWLPYCVHPITYDDDYSKGQLLVNRRYKPVGQITDDWADYGKHTNLHLHLNSAQITEVTAWKCSRGYLYYDSTCPWHSRGHAEKYLQQLQVLQAMLKR